MAEVPVTISGVLFDKYGRTTQLVTLMGMASITGLGVGGGPIIPPPGSGGNGDHIWGPTDPRPSPPIANVPGLPPMSPGGGPPGIWGPTDPRPNPPIYLPPNVPPELTPPQAPAPGSPTTPVPPPAGSAGWPVQPIVVPDYMVVWYPGVGPVVVAPPLTAQPKPETPPAQ